MRNGKESEIMAKAIRHPLKELRFTGGRFERNKGWLDFDVLSELQVYRKILIETAKEEWKRRNPGRERLPRGFEENIIGMKYKVGLLNRNGSIPSEK